MENNFFQFQPSTSTSNALPHDLDLSYVANGSIPEETPLENRSADPELENTSADEDTSYESADEIPGDDDRISPASENPSSDVVGMGSGLRRRVYFVNILIVVAVCVLAMTVSLAVWYKVNEGTMSDVDQYLTSGATDGTPLNVTRESNHSVHFNLTSRVSNSSAELGYKVKRSLDL